MLKKTHTEIEKKLARIKRGHLIFLSDFRGTGTDSAIRKSLSRLAMDGKIKRIAQGVYVLPIIDPVLGELMPSAEKIAEEIAQKERIRIKPVGSFALHKLGLTTQIPMKLVYLTDGSAKTIKVGKNIIKFKPTTPKRLSTEGKLSGLIIQAIEELGTDNLELEIASKIKELLHKEDRNKLIHDLKLAPARISDFLFALLKDEPNDGMVKVR